MEGESNNLENNPDRQSSHLVHDAGSIFQPIRVRRSPVLANPSNWKFVESELRFVLYCGAIFWAVHLLSMAL